MIKNNKNSPSLYYKNLFDNYETVYQSIYKGLAYYKDYIEKVEKRLRSYNFGLYWEKFDVWKYKLYPIYILKEKKKTMKSILLHVNLDFFEKNKDEIYILTNPRRLLEFDNYEENGEGKVKVFLAGGVDLTGDEGIFLNKNIIKWEICDNLNSKYSEEKTFITDSGVEVRGIGKPHGQYIEYLLDTSKLISDRNFELENISFKRNHPEAELLKLNFDVSEFKDDQGFIQITNKWEKNDFYFIETRKRIEGTLYEAETRAFINYIEIAKKDEKWILLKEGNEKHEFLDEGSSAIDIFIDMLYAGIKQEITVKKYKGKREYYIKVLKINIEEGLLQVKEYPPENRKIYPPKITGQLLKQIKAIDILLTKPSSSHLNLVKLFMDNSKIQWDELRVKEEDIKWEFLKPIEGKLRDGTEIQKRFVLKALNTPDFAILEGPPGSGKTTSITELIYQLTVVKKKKVLLSASTHVAIDNVLEKLLEKYETKEKLFEVGIVPLRIGREEYISENIQEFQIDNRIEQLKKKLEADGFKSNNEEDEFFTNIVIASSNLVCGTTIGILAYPNFEIERYVEPEFDYLIIDEASKTTLQQFLVPAINAKRWILTGDVKQLSPYTENLHVRISLEGLLETELQEAILLYFVLFFNMSRSRIDYQDAPKVIVFRSKEVIQEFLGHINRLYYLTKKMNNKWKHFQAFEKSRIVILTRNELKNSKLLEKEPFKANTFWKKVNSLDLDYNLQFKLYMYDVIIVEKDLLKNENLLFKLPITHLIINQDTNRKNFKKFFLQHKYVFDKGFSYKYRQSRQVIDNIEEIADTINEELKRSWSGQLAWRIQRLYELENTKEKGKNYYEASVNVLSSVERGLKSKIYKIAQIYFPSILTALQNGIFDRFRADIANVLTEGIKREAFEQRYEILEYQHRMHDDIAKIPRALFYDEKALKTSSSILKEGEREWEKGAEYNRYDNRFVWIHCSSRDIKNRNDREAEYIVKELKEFIDYAKTNKEKRWTVLLLTFYNKQKNTLGDKLKNEYKFLPKSSRTHFNIYNTKVMIYTVDKVQGREADIVFLSLVRNRRIGFMDSPNRINVAITRARYLQVIIGNYDFFSTCNSNTWNRITRYLAENDAVYEKKGKTLRKKNITEDKIKQINQKRGPYKLGFKK